MIQSPEQLKNRIRCTLLLFTVAIVLWELPITNNIVTKVDHLAYHLTNQWITQASNWKHIAAILNHKHESWLNIVVMTLINVIIIFQTPKEERGNVIKHVVYFLFLYQFVIIAVHFIFQNILEIKRQSPSLVFYQEDNSISNLLGTSSVKEFSSSSFPAGHALVAVYWCLFSLMLKPNTTIKLLIFTITGTLCVNRLLTGAHWLTDILFTINLGFFFHYLSIHPLIFRIRKLPFSKDVAFVPNP